ncbi:MAG: hypothetical protein LC799_26530 [Actinobacteria bacterium]|nr:hypothetical protein [Actinomycetota bacterium]
MTKSMPFIPAHAPHRHTADYTLTAEAELVLRREECAAVSERTDEGQSGNDAAGVTCVSPAVKALLAEGSGPEAVVKVERPQRSEDERP